MNDYVKKLSNEADFLVDTVLTGEEVYAPGDKEFNEYIAGVKTIDKMVYKHESLESKERLESEKEQNRHEEAILLDERESKKEANRHEEAVESMKIDRDDRARKAIEESHKIEFEASIEREKERNRHNEEIAKMYADVFVNTSKTAGELAGTIVKGIVIIGAVKIISDSEETKVLSRMAMDVVTKFVKIF